jgi:CheY-like chemotaxis protein
MNEPWINVSTRVDARKGVPYGPIIATDRLGFRSRLVGPRPAIDGPPPVGPKLVLVEDSDDDAMLFILALRQSGRNVSAARAATAAEARQLLAGARPALIVLDCHLPGESGLDLLREIRSLQSFGRVPIVMMSGSESDSDVQAAYANGANSFLRKSPSYMEYMSCVNTLLEYWLDRNCTAGLSKTPNSVWVG